MKKLIITIAVTTAFAIPFLLAHSTTEEEPNAYRGCVASAYQADARGVAGSTLESNLAICDKLLVAN